MNRKLCCCLLFITLVANIIYEQGTDVRSMTHIKIRATAVVVPMLYHMAYCDDPTSCNYNQPALLHGA